MISIFSAISAFILSYKADIASKVIASAAYDIIKHSVDLSSLKNRINRFFKSNEETDNYIETICTTEAQNPLKPFRDIEDTYEKITNKPYDQALFNEIKSWIQENEKILTEVSEMNFTNNSGFNIGVQNAKNNIYNISGDYNKNIK